MPPKWDTPGPSWVMARWHAMRGAASCPFMYTAACGLAYSPYSRPLPGGIFADALTQAFVGL
jgi:hypothetical protein